MSKAQRRAWRIRAARYHAKADALEQRARDDARDEQARIDHEAMRRRGEV